MKKFLPYFLIAIFCLVFFSYRLTQVPQGLTIDESAFGHNAILLSETLHDENNRFLPAFVLSINSKDWRQPVTQYFMTGYFKLFDPSIYNLKFTSVIVVAVGALLIFFLGNHLLGKKGGVLSLLFYATTPIIMIHSHLGLDNIMPIPFVLSWLISIYFYEKKGNLKYLYLSALSLGIGFYSYKGMRSFVPVWSVITTIYLALPALKSFWNPTKRDKKISWEFVNNLKKDLKPALVFIFSILPFYAIIPLLEYKYADAVLGQTNLQIDSIYKFLLSYVSSFDFSFLFITGDALPHHSTGVHGVFLLASLPFFLIGLGKALQKDKFWKLIVASFFMGPLLFGFPGSIHRASRLIALVPIYSLICALGAKYLWKKLLHPLVISSEVKRKSRNFKPNLYLSKIIFVILVILFSINYYDFIKYYWFQYPKNTSHIFYRTEIEKAYKILKEESKRQNLTPHVDSEIIRHEKLNDQGITDTFLRSIYFLHPPMIWTEQTKLPKNSILMSKNSDIPNLKKSNFLTDIEGYYFFTN